MRLPVHLGELGLVGWVTGVWIDGFRRPNIAPRNLSEVDLNEAALDVVWDPVKLVAMRMIYGDLSRWFHAWEIDLGTKKPLSFYGAAAMPSKERGEYQDRLLSSAVALRACNIDGGRLIPVHENCRCVYLEIQGGA